MVKLENQKNQNKGLKKSKLTKEDSSESESESDIDIQEEIEKQNK